ncbi:MAG: hypothetical protein F6K03_03460, partial [Kamptonema sp. SIO4C4]|nr:hypothetical protein [Kamptonema sp. SIO4C4]
STAPSCAWKASAKTCACCWNTRKGWGILPTWPTPVTYARVPSWLASLVLIPIDHCLVSPELTTTNIYTINDIGSDHRSLMVDLRLKTTS